MLDAVVCFSKGGAVLWAVGQLLTVHGNAINTLVRQCLLEDRGGESSFTYQPAAGVPYTLKWTLDNVRKSGASCASCTTHEVHGVYDKLQLAGAARVPHHQYIGRTACAPPATRAL